MLLRALKIAHKQRKLCCVLRQYSKAKGEITTSKKKKKDLVRFPFLYTT